MGEGGGIKVFKLLSLEMIFFAIYRITFRTEGKKLFFTQWVFYHLHTLLNILSALTEAHNLETPQFLTVNVLTKSRNRIIWHNYCCYQQTVSYFDKQIQRAVSIKHSKPSKRFSCSFFLKVVNSSMCYQIKTPFNEIEKVVCQTIHLVYTFILYND